MEMYRGNGKWNDNHCGNKRPYICKKFNSKYNTGSLVRYKLSLYKISRTQKYPKLIHRTKLHVSVSRKHDRNVKMDVSDSRKHNRNVKMDVSVSRKHDGNVKMDVSVSLKHDGNVKMDVSVSLKHDGNVKIDVSVVFPLFGNKKFSLLQYE